MRSPIKYKAQDSHYWFSFYCCFRIVICFSYLFNSQSWLFTCFLVYSLYFQSYFYLVFFVNVLRCFHTFMFPVLRFLSLITFSAIQCGDMLSVSVGLRAHENLIGPIHMIWASNINIWRNVQINTCFSFFREKDAQI